MIECLCIYNTHDADNLKSLSGTIQPKSTKLNNALLKGKSAHIIKIVSFQSNTHKNLTTAFQTPSEEGTRNSDNERNFPCPPIVRTRCPNLYSLPQDDLFAPVLLQQQPGSSTLHSLVLVALEDLKAVRRGSMKPHQRQHFVSALADANAHCKDLKNSVSMTSLNNSYCE